MTEAGLRIPATGQLVLALEAMIDPRFVEPIYLSSTDLERVRALLTLRCVGGPEMPEMPEREARFQEVRNCLRTCAARFYDLDRREFPRQFKPRDRSDEAYAEEARRLTQASIKLLQLGRERDPERDMTSLWRELSNIWGKNQTWFKRYRLKYVLDKLAECLAKEELHGEELADSSDLQPGGDATKEEPGGEAADGGDRAKAEAEEPEPVPPITARYRAKRRLPLRVAVGVFAAVIVVGALALSFITWGDSARTVRNPAGDIGRVLKGAPSEDLTVGGGLVWLVDSSTAAATRIAESDGGRETIFLDHLPYVAQLAPGAGSQIGGYRVAAGVGGAWIVVNDGTVLRINSSGRKAVFLSRVKVDAGEPVFYRHSLWIGGIGSYPLVRLDDSDGRIEREYRLRGSRLGIGSLAAGVGAIWALDRVHERRAYKLTPVSGRLGVEESLLPLDRRARELAAGLGALWTVNEDGTVTRHDPATGNPSNPIRVPGGAQKIALSRDAVWIVTGNQTVVRIDPITLSIVGQPIKLPGYPRAIGADGNVWVSTDRKLVEIALSPMA